MRKEAAKAADAMCEAGIPGFICTGVAGYLNSLSMRILRSAAQAASQRGPNGATEVRVCMSDVLRAARAIFPNLEADFERFLSEVETSHGSAAA